MNIGSLCGILSSTRDLGAPKDSPEYKYAKMHVHFNSAEEIQGVKPLEELRLIHRGIFTIKFLPIRYQKRALEKARHALEIPIENRVPYTEQKNEIRKYIIGYLEDSLKFGNTRCKDELKIHYASLQSSFRGTQQGDFYLDKINQLDANPISYDCCIPGWF